MIGKYNHKFLRRFYVKLIKGGPPAVPVENQTYIDKPWIEVFKGCIAYQLTLKMRSVEFCALVYHEGSGVRGIRLEVTINTRSRRERVTQPTRAAHIP